MSLTLIEWAFLSPIVSLGTRSCGPILLVAFLCYIFTRAQSHQQKLPAIFGRMAMGLLLIIFLATLALLQTGFGEYWPMRMTVLAAAGLILLSLIAIEQSARRWPDLAWGALFGAGVMGCGPNFFSLIQLLHGSQDLSGLVYLLAYTLALLILTLTALIALMGIDGLMKRVANQYISRITSAGRLGLIACGVILILQ